MVNVGLREKALGPDDFEVKMLKIMDNRSIGRVSHMGKMNLGLIVTKLYL